MRESLLSCFLFLYACIHIYHVNPLVFSSFIVADSDAMNYLKVFTAVDMTHLMLVVTTTEMLMSLCRLVVDECILKSFTLCSNVKL